MRGARVIVAGAGLAGLAAAHELAVAGAAVTVVDARAAAGGRVCTVRAFAAGQHAELGGEFIEPDHREIVGLCRQLALPRVRVLRAGFTHRFRDESGIYHVSRTAPWDALTDALSSLVRSYKSAGGDSASRAVREMATISLGEWLRKSKAPDHLLPMAKALRGFFLAEPDEISVLPVVEQIAKGGSPAQVEFFRIEGGNDRLVNALIGATPGRLLFGHTIRAVAHAVDRVAVTVLDASGLTQQIEGDYLVMALPASTLRNVEIRPALPDRQQHAISRLAYGRATKVLLQSPSNLFGTRRARAFATDSRLGAFWDASEEQASASSIIAFLGGASASAELCHAAADGGRALLADLCWLGMNREPIAALHISDWTADPYARGGYAFFDPGFDPAWRSWLGRRAGRIVFAGEHTSERWQGYMNGAVESGQRAARELLHQ